MKGPSVLPSTRRAALSPEVAYRIGGGSGQCRVYGVGGLGGGGVVSGDLRWVGGGGSALWPSITLRSDAQPIRCCWPCCPCPIAARPMGHGHRSPTTPASDIEMPQSWRVLGDWQNRGRGLHSCHRIKCAAVCVVC